MAVVLAPAVVTEVAPLDLDAELGAVLEQLRGGPASRSRGSQDAPTGGAHVGLRRAQVGLRAPRTCPAPPRSRPARRTPRRRRAGRTPASASAITSPGVTASASQIANSSATSMTACLAQQEVELAARDGRHRLGQAVDRAEVRPLEVGVQDLDDRQAQRGLLRAGSGSHGAFTGAFTGPSLLIHRPDPNSCTSPRSWI